MVAERKPVAAKPVGCLFLLAVMLAVAGVTLYGVWFRVSKCCGHLDRGPLMSNGGALSTWNGSARAADDDDRATRFRSGDDFSRVKARKV